MISVNTIIGLESIISKSYVSELLNRIPSDFFGLNPSKIIMVGVTLFFWQASTRGFENWRTDIREVMKEAKMGPIAPEWSTHVATNDLLSALCAIITALLFVK